MASVRRFNICLAKPKGNDVREGVWWHQIGKASENEKGQISLFFDSLPIGSWDGRAMLFEQRDRDERGTPPSGGSSGIDTRRQHRDDDDIPL